MLNEFAFATMSPRTLRDTMLSLPDILKSCVRIYSGILKILTSWPTDSLLESVGLFLTRHPHMPKEPALSLFSFLCKAA